MARGDPELSEPAAGEGDVGVELRVTLLATLGARREQAELLELTGEPRVDAGALAEPVRSSSGSSSPRPARLRLRSRAAGEASSWRMTRSGRNSSRWSRRIVSSRSRSSSLKSR